MGPKAKCCILWSFLTIELGYVRRRAIKRCLEISRKVLEEKSFLNMPLGKESNGKPGRMKRDWGNY